MEHPLVVVRIIRDIKTSKQVDTQKPKAFAQVVAKQSSLYREISAEKEEILRHKWFLSEKAGYDVGFGTAAYDWISKHRAGWRKVWRKRHGVPVTFA